MASNSGKTRGLLVVGAALGLAAVAIGSGLNDNRDRSPKVPSDQKQIARAEESPSTRPTAEATDQGEKSMFGASKTKKDAGAVLHATDDDFRSKVLEADGRVLVDFYADWCGPCRMLGPVLEELAREEPAARIVKVNVDHSPGVANHYRIQSIPALMVFENGRVVHQHVGLANKAQLRTMLGL